MIDDHRTLPGGPRKSLVLKVRRHLSHYGIAFKSNQSFRLNQIWRDAWTWADACRSRFDVIGKGKSMRFGPRRWPEPREIATQYLFLLMAEMRNNIALALPFEVRHEGRIPAALALEYLPDLKRTPTAIGMDLTVG